MTPLSPYPVQALDAVALRPVPKATAAAAEQARKTGLEFEEVFLAQLIGPIFDAMPADGPFGGGTGERMFRSLQVNEYAKAIVGNGGIGIADAVAREIIRLQEKANG